MHPFTNIQTLISSTISTRANIKMGVTRKESTPNFLKNEHFLPPDTQTYVCVSGGRKCSFFRKFGVLWFLVTPVLRVALLSYYRWFTVLRLRWLLHIFHLSECNYQLLDEIYPPNMRTLLLCNERQLQDNCIYP